ncbi:MAG TPA: sigma-70 family RNA polymerase sigma factor [Acidimicrobiia bacterium]|nr:sigma-70 family RNA polymerase sigma factor [Acidimicrobiia bacterium]
MPEDDWMVDQFEAHRAHLRTVAYRMLGSADEADDAVQEAWFRLNRSDASEIENLGGWLTTVVGRVSLDMLRSRASRREDPAGAEPPDPASAAASPAGGDPEHEAVLADTVGSALLVVLDTLTPAERLAFVLHDLFAVPFEEIGAIVGRSPNAAKQLASRARRKVQGRDAAPDADPARRREVVDAFLAASRGGDFDALVALLDPDVVLVADATAVSMGSPEETRGAAAVAGTFSGRAQAAQPALVDGTPGVVWAVRGRPRVVWDFTIEDGKVVHIDMLAAGETLDDLDLTILEG